MTPRIILSLLVWSFSGAGVHAWGPLGHRTIASLALEQVQKKNPAAAAKVREILQGESIEDASIWPDDVRPNRNPARSGRFAGTPEGLAFNSVHPDNSKWHYVDLPLDAKAYGVDKRFTDESDIVATLEKCIDVLEGKSEFMSKRDALRYLVHLTGDVHQPLHVAVGFFKFDGAGQATLITDPDEAAANMNGNDSGGNKLLLEKDLPLHKYWDENLVELNAKTQNELAEKLRDRVKTFKTTTTGALRSWPAQWATDSIGVSRVMYRELTFGKRFPRTGNYWTLYLNFQKGTKEKFTEMAAEQLVKSAANLAEILANMQWGK